MVDGANPVSRFFKITLPLLTPTIFFNLVMQMINGFLAFTQCYIITQGKPMNSTLLYTVYMYQQSFEFYNDWLWRCHGLGHAADDRTDHPVPVCNQAVLGI